MHSGEKSNAISATICLYLHLHLLDCRCYSIAHTPREYLSREQGGGGLDQAAKIWAIRGDEGVKELGVLQVDCLQYFHHLRLGML